MLAPIGSLQSITPAGGVAVAKVAGGANPANFVDGSLVQELEKEGVFQTKAR
jgi:hypothetical protein